MSNPYVDSYDNPLDRARALLKQFEDFADIRCHKLPTTRYVQVGDVVRDCESVIVSATNLVPDPAYDPVECVPVRSATFLIDVVRPCAIAFDRNGKTIPDKLECVSEIAAKDGQVLYDFAADVPGWSSKQPWSVIWSLGEAGLQVASLQLTIGIP